MPVRLCIHLPDDAALLRVVEDHAPVSFGRDAGCDIVLAHASVSRRHALLERRVDGWWISDLASKNGVSVGGQRAERARLKSGQWFSLGDVFCLLEEVSPEQAEQQEARNAQRRESSKIWVDRLAQAQDREALLENLITAIVQLADCRRGFLLVGDSLRGLAVKACYDIEPASLDGKGFMGSTGVVERAVQQRVPVLESNLAERPWLKDRASVVAHSLRAVACLPLEHEGRLLGVAYADSDEPGKLFTALDREILSAFASQAALAVVASGLADSLRQLERAVAVNGGGTVRVATTRSNAVTPTRVPRQ
jgi:hypothetical protein